MGACGDDGGPPDASVSDAVAGATSSFSMAWTLSDGTNPLRCDQVSAQSVSVALIRQGVIGGSSEAFSCDGGKAVSRQLLPGLYNLTIDLRAAGSRSLLDQPIQFIGIELVPNLETEVPAQDFVVAPSGAFQFTVDGAAASNCDAESAGGAGMVGLTLTLQDESQSCVPAIYDVAAGSGGVAGSYPGDCSTPVQLPCIDKDQQVSVNPAQSGAMSLSIVGQKLGPVDCYQRVTKFDVPGAMLETELGTLRLSLAYSLACDPNFISIDAAVPPVIDGGMP